MACLLPTYIAEARVGGGDILLRDKNVRVTFSHERHVKEMGFSCTKCHPKLFITTAKRKSVSDTLLKCLTCHPRKW